MLVGGILVVGDFTYYCSEEQIQAVACFSGLIHVFYLLLVACLCGLIHAF
jgi:hypothetical protein